jgi:fatty-acyl-CoA synthase
MPGVTTWIALTDRAHMPASALALLCYEDLLASESDDFEWPEFDENTASGLCYTSGTTGHPKGVLFSHRSTVLHALATCLPDAKAYSAQSVVLPIVPMFHANAWGIPYSAPLVGAKVVFPGAGMDGRSLYELFESEGVNFSAGVPTVWLTLIQYMKQNNLVFSTLKTTTIGGSACPSAMIQTLRDEFDVRVLHGWGMTEMSPVGTIGSPKAKHANLSADERLALSLKQGRRLYGVEMKIIDGNGEDLPTDGVATGNVVVKGPWVMRHYFKSETPDTLTPDGWFPTGDVGSIDPDGYLSITDRSKDVIKSGGEWISSIELENIAVGHPAVAEAAVIGVFHPQWNERPLLIVVKKQGASVTRDELPRVLRRQGRPMVDAGRRRVRRRAAAHGNRQAVEKNAARAIQGIPAGHRLTGGPKAIVPAQLHYADASAYGTPRRNRHQGQDSRSRRQPNRKPPRWPRNRRLQRVRRSRGVTGLAAPRPTRSRAPRGLRARRRARLVAASRALPGECHPTGGA